MFILFTDEAWPYVCLFTTRGLQCTGARAAFGRPWCVCLGVTNIFFQSSEIIHPVLFSAESFLMSAFHNGFLRTMKASYNNDEGDIRIIRPFVTTRERDISAFAHKVDLPIIPENCPACFSAPKERARVKQLLAAQVRPDSILVDSTQL